MALGDASFARSSGGFRGKDHTASCLHIHCLSCLSSQTLTQSLLQHHRRRAVGLLVLEAVSLQRLDTERERGKKKAGIRAHTHSGRDKARNTFPTTISLLFRRLGNDTRRRRVQHRTTPLLLRSHRRAVACVPKPVQGSPTPPTSIDGDEPPAPAWSSAVLAALDEQRRWLRLPARAAWWCGETTAAELAAWIESSQWQYREYRGLATFSQRQQFQSPTVKCQLSGEVK